MPIEKTPHNDPRSNKLVEPTSVGDGSSAVAVHAASRRHSFVRSAAFAYYHENNEQKRTNMKSQTLGLRVAGTIFALACLAHLLRVVTRVDVLIAGHQIPLWTNMVGVVISGALSLWMWRISAPATR